MKRLMYGTLLISCVITDLYPVKRIRKAVLKEKGKRGNPFYNLHPRRVQRFFKHFIEDTRGIGEQIFTVKTMKVVTGILPFYLITRHVDQKVHNYFYDSQLHKNIHQPPDFLVDMAYTYLPLPLTCFGLLGLTHDDPYIRRRSQIFAVGTLWSYGLKMMLKNVFKSDGSLRPLNEKFDPTKRVHGGSPSGHMAMMAYFSTFWALEMGPYWAIPLSAYSLLGIAMCTTSNRHYLSQTIAGAGLGIVLGVASHALVTSIKLPESVSLGVNSTSNSIGLSLVYDF